MRDDATVSHVTNCTWVRALLAAAACCVWANAAVAQATWTGGTSTDWATSTNWSGTAPTVGSSLDYVFGTAANQNTNNTLANLTANSITFNTGGFTLGGNSVIDNGTIANSNGTNAISLNLNMAADQAVTVAAGTQLTISGVLGTTGGNRNLAVNGPGTLILANANTYGGTTNITGGGTLLATNTTGSATGALVNVQSGTLGGSGSIGGTVFVPSGSTIRAGTGTANPTLTLNNASLGLLISGTYAAQLYGTGPTDISLISATGGGVEIISGALLTLDLSALSSAQVDSLRASVGVGNSRTYTVIQATITGSFGAGNFSIANLGSFDSREWSYVTNPASGTEQVRFTPVSEPGLVLLAGSVVLAAAACLGRRRVTAA
jgi:fibronectin-binding autotransporter adhesin